jgi:hypothetical protein
MKIDYFAILTAFLNKAFLVLNLNKKCVSCQLQHKMFGFLKGMKIDYFAILTASLNKAFFDLYLTKKTASCAACNIKCLVFYKVWKLIISRY